MIVKTKKGDLPVRYGMNALAKYGDLTGKSMNEVMSSLEDFGKLKVSELLAFIYSGFFDGARWDKSECKVSGVEDIGDMMDDDPKLAEKMFTAFNDEAEESEEGKKK